jgi:hypothetical protein
MDFISSNREKSFFNKQVNHHNSGSFNRTLEVFRKKVYELISEQLGANELFKVETELKTRREINSNPQLYAGSSFY